MMAKKILILNGSPRRHGNTSALVRELTRGAEESGHTVTAFNLHQMNIKGCLGCWRGGRDGACSPCTLKDDMDQIYPHYHEADIVVLASPLYFWHISGQLKTAFDRLWATGEYNNGVNPHKETVLLMASIEDKYEEVKVWYHRIMKELSWTDKGMVLVSDVEKPGDIEGHAKLNEAYKLGQSL